MTIREDPKSVANKAIIAIVNIDNKKHNPETIDAKNVLALSFLPIVLEIDKSVGIQPKNGVTILP